MDTNETGTGYRGRFGNVPVIGFFQQEDWYHQMFIKYTDPRTVDGFWLRTPEATLAVIFFYLLFVAFGPRWMERRAAMNLKPVIIVYNFIMVAVSAYMSVEFFLTAFHMGYSYGCQGVDWQYSTDPLSMRLVNISWLFFLSKIIELADTVFFILRKKDNQVTFLHVYHHATMIANWWMAAKYIPVGQSFFVGMVNSFIHALMYLYYGLAAIGPHMQKYLWWKKHMTTMQLIQFIAIISHTAYNKFLRPDCDYPFLYNSIVFYYTISMVVLFSDFYYRTYVRSGRKKTERDRRKPQTVNNNGHLPEKDADNSKNICSSNGTTDHVSNGIRSRKS
jgi:elongation of very long chain fatty acids protein 4